MKQQSNLLSTLLLLLAATASLLLTRTNAADTARSIQIMNESTRRVEVHWVHPDTGEMVLQSTPDILHGASFALNSYVSHTFQVRELPAKKTGVCAGEGKVCRIDHFTVNSNQDQGELLVYLILYIMFSCSFGLGGLDMAWFVYSGVYMNFFHAKWYALFLYAHLMSFYSVTLT